MTDLERQDTLEVTLHWGKYEMDLRRMVAESLENIMESLSINTLEDAIYFEVRKLRENDTK